MMQQKMRPGFRFLAASFLLKIVFPDNRQVIIQFIDQRLPGRNFQGHDLIIGYFFDIFDQSPQRVSVGRHQNRLAIQYRRSDLVFPEWDDEVQSGFQILPHRNDTLLQVGVPSIPDR